MAETESTDFFTADLERALLEGKIDAAVHSAKDLEDEPPEKLLIAALTGSVSTYEALVSKDNIKLKDLRPGAIIGTSSRKRRRAVLRFRKDLTVKDIRGDIDERINQLDSGIFDAVIIAHAALLRLGHEDRITEIIPPEIIEPHPLQGRLVIQVQRERFDIIDIFRRIDEK